jgi:hypothetical protein
VSSFGGNADATAATVARQVVHALAVRERDVTRLHHVGHLDGDLGAAAACPHPDDVGSYVNYDPSCRKV